MTVRFFTIVLNGMPFIRYHAGLFRRLPFPWHWHVVEGVAAHRHDTAWAQKLGGCIPDELHDDGLSHDGTSEFLDRIAREEPDRVTIYRKPRGLFWDGKQEMVNAPLADIRKGCLLWEVDADELWTPEQIIQAREMFLDHPEKTSAYYYCHYFVGPGLVTTTRDTYGNYTGYEWLRTWRFRPGFHWRTHEPPRLCARRLMRPWKWTDIGALSPFRHRETEERGLVFQHYAYATEEQLRFKEIYYGYERAVERWKDLQQKIRFPVRLSDYFPWVSDAALVDTVESRGIRPIAVRGDDGAWRFQGGG